MREIKFRAWDKEDEEYISWYQLTHTRYNQDYLREHGDPEGPFLSMMTDKYIQLEQFTGLRDKNGKEIYEGDIYKCEYEDGPQIVEYYEGYEGDSHPVQGFIFCSFFREDNVISDIEVIGNIHENPELIHKE